MIHKWTTQEEEFLRTNYPHIGCKQCAIKLGIERSKVKAKASNMSLIGPRREPLTPEQIEWFIASYPNTSTSHIASTLGISRSMVYHLAETYNLHKTIEFISQTRREMFDSTGLRAHQFQPGHIPFSKGRKMSEWMSLGGIARSSATRFHKGNRPKNWRPVGSERVNIYGYIEVKVEEGRYGWAQKHRVVWEEANGPIPAGYNVMFRDGNRQNCALDNLYLASNQEKMARNTIHNYPKDLKNVMMLRGLVKREINKQTKTAAK